MKHHTKKPILLFTLSLFFVAVIYMSCQKKNKGSSEEGTLVTSTAMIPDERYVGEMVCKDCHAKEFEEWQNSHHDKAMMKADENSVLADFDNTSFTNQDGMKTRFYQKGEEYWVNTQGPEGGYHDYKVIYTFGITPLQQYIVEFPDGKFQCLSTAWDTIENKWFDLYPTFHVVPSEWLHQSRGALNWNTMCADCHSTNVRKNYFEKADSFNTKYSLVDVSCEACHGPGKTHVEHARVQGEDYHFEAARENLYLTTGISPQQQVDQCARCHSRREQLTLAFNHQGNFLDHYYPRLLDEGAYHGDGQILDEVYVYGSFVQSKMYMNNVKCTDCHNPHIMKLKMVGNALCLQCHVPEKYDVELHTFHKPETEGSQCINCHMTGKLYMVNDYRRDHSFRVPRPDLSIAYGSPNACNECHTDKSNEWAWGAYKNWYGPVDSTYYTDILSYARTGDPTVVDYLVKLTGNNDYPPIVRATGIQYLSRIYDASSQDAIIKGLSDDDPLVRAASIDGLDEFNISNTLQNKLFELLGDEKRAVRIKAYQVLATIPESQIPEDRKAAFQHAKSEFLTSLDVLADFSGGQAEKAIYLQRIGKTQEAISAYEKALEIDDHNNPARNNLANLYYEKGDFDNAEKCFREILEQEPGHGQTYYSLALLLSEQGNYKEAVPELEKAVEYLPKNSRVRYNLGLIYQNLGQLGKAEKTLLDGLSINHSDESLLYAMVYFYVNVKQDQVKARNYAEQLVEYYPNNQEYRNLLKNFIQ